MPITIYIKGGEVYDEIREEFRSCAPAAISLEHSLISLSKWESKWEKPFLKPGYEMTEDEAIDYIRCMTMTQNVNPEVYYFLDADNIKEVSDYIAKPMSATVIPDDGDSVSNRQIMTSELFYYYMFELGIPIECQKWHLNRLIKLIEVFNFERKKQEATAKNKGKKRQATSSELERRAALNKQRQKELGTKG